MYVLFVITKRGPLAQQKVEGKTRQRGCDHRPQLSLTPCNLTFIRLQQSEPQKEEKTDNGVATTLVKPHAIGHS